jgi:hypothetical protein
VFWNKLALIGVLKKPHSDFSTRFYDLLHQLNDFWAQTCLAQQCLTEQSTTNQFVEVG